MSKVLLTQVQSLTFQEGEYAASRRSSKRIPQLECVKGDACRYWKPRTVLCENMGSDGTPGGVNWKCRASMSDRYELGAFTVNCEGYAHRDDPYILVGSCGLQYSLYLTEKGRKFHGVGSGGSRNDYEHGSGSSESGLNTFFSIIFIFLFIYFMIRCLSRSNGSDHDYQRPPPSYPSNHGPGTAYDPPPPYNPDYPSSSAPLFGGNTRGPSCSTSVPPAPTTSGGFFSGTSGFWSGLAAGGILGSLASRSRYEPVRPDPYARSSHTERFTSFQRDDDDSTHESVSFGGTSRR